MAKLSITLAQMNIILGEPKRNLANMERMCAEASRRKSHIIVFPELFTTGYALEKAKDHSSELNKGTFADISKIATQYKIAITGSIMETRGLEVANSAPFFAPNGRMMGIYRKIHLFQLMLEDQYLQPGTSPLVMHLPWGVTGLAICYDLRFPELFRRYVIEQEAKIIIIPAEWPIERIDHWRSLLIARAIENQCYIIATNACGNTGGTVFGGHSMIVDPWGKIVVEAGEDPMLLTADIDLDLVDTVRNKLPAIGDARRDVLFQSGL